MFGDVVRMASEGCSSTRLRILGKRHDEGRAIYMKLQKKKKKKRDGTFLWFFLHQDLYLSSFEVLLKRGVLSFLFFASLVRLASGVQHTRTHIFATIFSTTSSHNNHHTHPTRILKMSMKYYLRMNGFAEHQWIHFMVQENEPSIGTILSGHTPQNINNEVQVKQNSTTGPQNSSSMRFQIPTLIGREGPTDRDLREVYSNGVSEPRLVRLKNPDDVVRSTSGFEANSVEVGDGELLTLQLQFPRGEKKQGNTNVRRKRPSFTSRLLAAKAIMGWISVIIGVAGDQMGFISVSFLCS